MREDSGLKKAPQTTEGDSSSEGNEIRTTKGQRLYFSGKVSPAKHEALGTMVSTAKNTKQNKHRLPFTQGPRKAAFSTFITTVISPS